jgi:hypothetical protein
MIRSALKSITRRRTPVTSSGLPANVRYEVEEAMEATSVYDIR